MKVVERRERQRRLTGCAIAALGLAALALTAGCSGGSYRITAWFDDAGLRARARSLDVALVPSCEAVGETGEEPEDVLRTLRFRVGEPSGELGAVDPGTYGLSVRARDEACAVIAAGCAVVHLEAGGSGELVVPVSAVDGPACRPDERCDSGLCAPGGGDGDGDADEDVAGDADEEVDGEAEADEEEDADHDVVDADEDADQDADVDDDRPCSDDDDCLDSDPCTIDLCEGSTCVHLPPDDAGLSIVSSSSGRATVAVDLGGPGLDPGRIHCFASRDFVWITGHDFDDGSFGGLYHEADPGSVTLEHGSDAYDPSHGFGARICGRDAGVGLDADLRSVDSGLAWLFFSARTPDLGPGEYLVVDYSTDGGTQWSVIALLGDNAGPTEWDEYNLLLPEDAASASLVLVSIWRDSGTGCADVDDIGVLGLPRVRASSDLLREGFETGTLGSLAASPSGTDDIGVTGPPGNRVAYLLDNADAFLWASVDASALDPVPTALLMVTWQWEWISRPPGGDEYALAEYSIDAGATWIRIGASGLYDELIPSARRGGALLFPDGWYAPDLRVRFRAPSSSSTGSTHGVEIDDVAVTVVRPELVDVVGAFADVGDGVYLSTITTSTSGSREMGCTFACGDLQLWTNWVDLAL